MNDRPSDEESRSRLGDPQPQVTRLQRFRDLAVGVGLALAFAAVAMLLLPTRKDEDVVRGDEDGRLQIRATRAGEPLKPDEPLRAGDEVSFSYQGTGAGHLTVLGVDAGGRVRVHYPGGQYASPWSPGDPDLGPSTVLGADPVPVMFAGILCPEPVPVAEVRRALEATASTPERFALLTCQIDLVRTGTPTP